MVKSNYTKCCLSYAVWGKGNLPICSNCGKYSPEFLTVAEAKEIKNKYPPKPVYPNLPKPRKFSLSELSEFGRQNKIIQAVDEAALELIEINTQLATPTWKEKTLSHLNKFTASRFGLRLSRMFVKPAKT